MQFLFVALTPKESACEATCENAGYITHHMRITKSQRAALKRATGRGKRVVFKYKGSKRRYEVGTVDDTVSVLLGEYHHLIQRIKLTPEIQKEWKSRYAYRTCYYTLTARSRRPAWGQYHQLIVGSGFRQLAQKAIKKGWT
jgi:hypothetical protein